MCGGCDLVFGIGKVGPPPPPTPCLADEFETDPVSPAVWSVIDPASPTTVAAGGELAIELAPAITSVNGVRSVTQFDLTGGEARVELVEPPTAIGGVSAGMFVFLDDFNYYVIEVENAQLLLRSRTQGADAATTVHFDPVADRFWQIRHDALSDMISFETSPDRVTWAAMGTVPVTVSLTLLRAQLLGHVYKLNIGTPGRARFDNFEVLLPTCR
jgi:hypothetical protein